MPAKLRFSPGNLVLVKYSTYPIWPGTIQRVNIPGYNRFVDFQTNRSGDEVVAYWVVFSGDQEGGWIPAHNIMQYHPHLVSLIRVPAWDHWHDDQSKALGVADTQYAALFPHPRTHPRVSGSDRHIMEKMLELWRLSDDESDIVATRVDDKGVNRDEDCHDEHENDNDNDYWNTPLVIDNRRLRERNDKIATFAGEDGDGENDGEDDDDEERGTGRNNASSFKPCSSKGESVCLKGEPELMEALTYHPPNPSPRATRKRKMRSTRRPSRRRSAPRRSRRINGRFSAQQEIADLRECLRRRDTQIATLNHEARRIRAVQSSRLRHSVRERDQEIAHLRRETRELQTSQATVAPNSRIPTFEQWNRSTNPASFREAAGKLQNKYTAFCSGIRKYTRALEEIGEARAALSKAYQELREQAQMTENDIIDAEKALNSFGDLLRDVRFSSSSEDAVVICD